MKKLFYLFLAFYSIMGFSQQYNFVSKNAVEINKWKYIDFLNKTPKPEIDYRLENGKAFTQKTLDSIDKTKNSNKFTTLYLADSIANKVTVILKNRTDEEIKKDNEAFFDRQKKNKENRENLIGSTITDIMFTDIAGVKHTSESLLGKMVVLNFWFTKCAPCIKEMPDLNKLKAKYGTDNVVYFAITYDKIELTEKFLSRQPLDFTVIPNQQKTIDAFGVNFFPTNMLLDQNGKVLFVNELFNSKSNNGLTEIDKLIKKHTK